MKLLPWPTTQIGAATANNSVRNFTRDIGFVLRITSTPSAETFPVSKASRSSRIYRVTLTVTLSYVNTAPSLATARSTYVPGSLNVA